MILYFFEERTGLSRQSIMGARAESKTKTIKKLVSVMEAKATDSLSSIGKRVWSNRVRALKGYQKRGRLEKNYFIRKVEDETLQT